MILLLSHVLVTSFVKAACYLVHTWFILCDLNRFTCLNDNKVVLCLLPSLTLLCCAHSTVCNLFIDTRVAVVTLLYLESFMLWTAQPAKSVSVGRTATQSLNRPSFTVPHKLHELCLRGCLLYSYGVRRTTRTHPNLVYRSIYHCCVSVVLLWCLCVYVCVFYVGLSGVGKGAHNGVFRVRQQVVPEPRTCPHP